MASLTLTWDFRITLNGKDYAFLSPSTPPTISLSHLDEQTRTLADTTTIVLWDPTLSAVPSEPTTMDFFYCLTSVACVLELTCNEDDANDRVFAVPIAANIPFILGADESYYNFTASGDAYAGLVDVIDKIRLRNQSGASGTVTWAVGKT